MVSSAIFAAQPHAGMAGNIEFAVGIRHHAVPSRLVVIAHAFDGAIVLRHVEIDGPGPEHVGHFGERLVELRLVLPIVICRKKPRLGRVVAHGIEQRVGHVGLKTDGMRPVDGFQRVDHGLPGMHAAPTNFALRRQPLVIIGRNAARLAESLGNFLGVALGVLGKFAGACCRVDADDAVMPHAQVAQFLSEAA